MWDMKPDAPVEVCGEFRPIATSAPGIEFTEHLPLLARQGHHLALVRSLEMPGVENSHPLGLLLNNWDCHVDNFRALKEYLLPAFDRAIMMDLAERGLLDETLVVIGSDMGRNPRVWDALSSSGRNHWNFCQTAVLAGAGIGGGQLYGSSDKIAAYPKEHPVRPEDIAATVYVALGIYEDLWARDAFGRPYHLLEEGRPLPLWG